MARVILDTTVLTGAERSRESLDRLVAVDDDVARERTVIADDRTGFAALPRVTVRPA